MRVPSVGLPLDERRIVREAYQVAERMMRDYRDPPGLIKIVSSWLAGCRQMVLGVYRTFVRN